MNILFVYYITHTGTRKGVEFTLDFVTIYDMHENFNIVVGQVNH